MAGCWLYLGLRSSQDLEQVLEYMKMCSSFLIFATPSKKVELAEAIFKMLQDGSKLNDDGGDDGNDKDDIVFVGVCRCEVVYSFIQPTVADICIQQA